jgi:hypothetical protein
MEELENRNSGGNSARGRCGIRPADARSFPPALLTGDFLSEGIRSAADATGTFVIVAFDATVHSLVTFISAPGAGFGPAVPAGGATSVTASLNLTVPGRATLVWTSSPGPSRPPSQSANPGPAGQPAIIMKRPAPQPSP